MAEIGLLDDVDAYVFSSNGYAKILHKAAEDFDTCLVHHAYEGNRGIGDQRRGADLIAAS